MVKINIREKRRGNNRKKKRGFHGKMSIKHLHDNDELLRSPLEA